MIDSALIEYPQLTCYWRVIFDGNQFSAYEVSGLTEKMAYVDDPSGSQEGGSSTMRLARPSGGRLTIKWGIFSTDVHGAHMFHKWRNDRIDHPEKKVSVDILITLLDENGHDVIQWHCQNCVPIEYRGPTLKTDENSIAMQTLILEVEEIRSEYLKKKA